MDTLDKYEEAQTAFRTGSVLTDSNERLLLYLSGLSNQNNINEGTQHRDIIRGLTINNILLQRHIEKLQSHITELDKKNSTTQLLVVILTIASLFGAIGQIWYAYKADKRSELDALAIASQQQKPSQSAAKPSQPSTQFAPQPKAPTPAPSK